MGSVPRGECHRAAGGTAPREHTECHARTQSGRGGLSPIAPFYFSVVQLYVAGCARSGFYERLGSRGAAVAVLLYTEHFTLGVYPGREPKLKSSLGKGRTTSHNLRASS